MALSIRLAVLWLLWLPCAALANDPIVRLVRAIPSPAQRNDVATSVCTIRDGAVVAGYTKTDAGDELGLVMRLSDSGDVVWRREIGAKGENNLWSIQTDTTGGFVCAGYTNDTRQRDFDGWLLRIDDNGQVTWQKTYGQAGADKFWSVARDGDDWLAVGEADGRGAGGLDALVVRVDTNGKEIASFTSGTPQLDRAFSIVPMKANGIDDGCAIGGMTGRDRDHSFPFIVRLSRDGKEIWRRVINDAGFGVVHDLHAGAKDELIGIGYSQPKDRGNQDGLIMRLNSKGEIISKHTFGGPNADRALHARVFDDRSSVVIGYTQRAGPGDADSLWDLSIWRLDRNDAQTWTESFGGEKVEFGRAIAGERSNLWIAGHTASFGARSQIYVVRVSILD